jgi:Family of unknown function (DUF6510)
MDSADLHIDGNGMAGLLQEIFVPEITTGRRVCDGCGEEHPIGAHHAYAGAGAVLRCPGCGIVAASIVRTPRDHVIAVTGVWRLSRDA